MYCKNGKWRYFERKVFWFMSWWESGRKRKVSFGSQRHPLVHVLGIKQFLLQSLFLLLQPTAGPQLFAESMPALITPSLFVVLTMHRSRRNIHHHYPKISSLVACFSESKKVFFFFFFNDILFPVGLTKSSFFWTWTLKRAGSMERWTGDRNFQEKLDWKIIK